MKNRWSVIVASVAAVLLAATAVWAAESKAPEAAKAPASAKGATGKELFVSNRCTSCHSIASEKIKKKKAAAAAEAAAKEPAAEAPTAQKVPDLSGVGDKKDAAWISKFLMKEEKLDAKFHKIKFKGTPAELKTLSAWLETLKTPAEGEKAAAETPAATETPASTEQAAPPAGADTTKAPESAK